MNVQLNIEELAIKLAFLIDKTIFTITNAETLLINKVVGISITPIAEKNVCYIQFSNYIEKIEKNDDFNTMSLLTPDGLVPLIDILKEKNIKIN